MPVNELSNLAEFVPRRFQDFNDLAACSYLSSLHPNAIPMPSSENRACLCFYLSEARRLPHIKSEERSYWIGRVSSVVHVIVSSTVTMQQENTYPQCQHKYHKSDNLHNVELDSEHNI